MADFYFGNLNTGLVKRPAPETGMGASAVGTSEALEFANGGAYIAQSDGTHREFDLSWGAQNKSVMGFLSDYRNGLYGNGLLYMVDPFAANVMPPHWASPALTCAGWPSLLGPGTQPVRVAVGAVVRTNLTDNPAPVSTAGWNGAVTGVIATFSNGAPAFQTTLTTATTAYIFSDSIVGSVATGETITMAMDVEFPDGIPVALSVRAHSRAGNVYYSQGSYTIPANPQGVIRVKVTFVAPAGVPANDLDLSVVGSGSAPIGTRIRAGRLTIERGATSGDYFDGSTTFVDGTTTRWTGDAGLSTSELLRSYSDLPNSGAQYSLVGTPGTVPQRKLTLLIPEDRDLYLGFTGTASAGAALRMQTITRDGAYGPLTDLTMLNPAGSTRLNTKVSGASYRAVQVYMTPTAAGGGTVTLVSGKAVYALPTETPALTGGHLPGEGHTGLRFDGTPTMTYIQAARGRALVSTAAKFTEIEAWL